LDGLKLGTARKARQRPGFPQSRGQGSGGELLYSRAELADWSAARTNRHEADQQGRPDPS
jgi:hypothetical protein